MTDIAGTWTKLEDRSLDAYKEWLTGVMAAMGQPCERNEADWVAGHRDYWASYDAAVDARHTAEPDAPKVSLGERLEGLVRRYEALE